MKSATLSIKIDPSLKEDAQKVARDFGMPLGTLVSVLLKDVVRTRELKVDVSEQFPAEPMTPEMERLAGQAMKEIENGEVSPAFTDIDEAFAWLHRHEV